MVILRYFDIIVQIFTISYATITQEQAYLKYSTTFPSSPSGISLSDMTQKRA